jgi:hypothetical protein
MFSVDTQKEKELNVPTVFFETELYYVAWSGPKLKILLFHSPKCCGYMFMTNPHHSTFIYDKHSFLRDTALYLENKCTYWICFFFLGQWLPWSQSEKLCSREFLVLEIKDWGAMRSSPCWEVIIISALSTLTMFVWGFEMMLEKHKIFFYNYRFLYFRDRVPITFGCSVISSVWETQQELNQFWIN